MEKKSTAFLVFAGILVVLILTIVSIFNNQPRINETTPSTTASQATETQTTENQTTEIAFDPPVEIPTTPITEWGWYNLIEMGNALIQIEGYCLSKQNDSYVYISAGDDKYTFQNGYVLKSNFMEETMNYDSPSNPKRYTVVTNDVIDVDSDYYNIRNLSNRIVEESYPNFIVFRYNYAFGPEAYIPYSLIDQSRPYEKFTESKTNSKGETYDAEYYKLYLK